MVLVKTAGQQQAGMRLDDALVLLCSDMSKGEARRIIDRGGCRINGSLVRVASRTVNLGDMLEVGIMEPGRFRDLVLPAEALLYEDDELISVNKPEGIPSQRTPYQLKGTLEYWVTEYFRSKGSGESARMVHRLDRGTSGVMLFPKHRQGAARISGCLQRGELDKRYWALVVGRPDQEYWSCDAPIGKVGPGTYGVVAGGKSALTEFRVIAGGKDLCLIEARPITGRTHQIRVHLAAAGLPIVGDSTYRGISADRMMLHCVSLALVTSNRQPLSITADPGGAFSRMMQEQGMAVP